MSFLNISGLSGYWLGLLFALGATFFWGISPPFQKRALREMGLVEMNAARGAGMLLFLLVMIPFAGEEVLYLGGAAYLTLAGVSLLNNLIGDVFAFIAIQRLGVSVAFPITSSYLLYMPFIAWFWFGEALTSFVFVGTFFVVAGLSLVNARSPNGRDAASSETRQRLRGVVLALLAGLCWAVGLSTSKYLSTRGVDPSGITFWRGAFFGLQSVALALLWGLARWVSRIPPAPRAGRVSAGGILAGMGAGVFGLIIGSWCYNSSLPLIPMSVATPIAASCPLIAAVAACAFMDERLRPRQWLGIVFVVTGAAIVGL
ncbi:MAG: DMT family transporter [Synergistaceae bacterium]|nr:DMT family transporter [Synergistaceae bacterium]